MLKTTDSGFVELRDRLGHVCVQLLSCIWLFVTPWTAAQQAPLSMRFPRQGHWSGLPSPSPAGLPDSGITPTLLTSPALASTFFTPSAIWEARLGYNDVTNSHETHTRISSHSSNIQTTFQNGRSPGSDPGSRLLSIPPQAYRGWGLFPVWLWARARVCCLRPPASPPMLPASIDKAGDGILSPSPASDLSPSPPASSRRRHPDLKGLLDWTCPPWSSPSHTHSSAQRRVWISRESGTFGSIFRRLSAT